jgi:hypothetical protein
MAIIAMKKGHEMRSMKVAERKKRLTKQVFDICQRRARGNLPVAIEEKLLQGGFVAQLVEEESYYRYVEDQEQNLPFGGVAMDFVEFDG